jgi:hypothetical protein
MDNKDRIIKVLAALLLMMIAVAAYQRTEYENELGSMRHQMRIDSITIKKFENANND